MNTGQLLDLEAVRAQKTNHNIDAFLIFMHLIAALFLSFFSKYLALVVLIVLSSPFVQYFIDESLINKQKAPN